MPKELIISPVSIDLGAKNTGVYFAHYPADSSIEAIKKDGKVYQLGKDNYTLLMTDRTAKRHQRRSFDRRQMVKRLFKLIWEKHFGFEWDKDVQQTTSFLFNRRGFSFLTEEYDAKVLSEFPAEAFNELPEELQNEYNGEKKEKGTYDFSGKLIEWTNTGTGKVKEFFDVINKEPKLVAQRQVFISRTKKLKEYCETRKRTEKIEQESRTAKVKLSQLSKWIWDEWQQTGVQGLDDTFVAKDQNSGSVITWKNAASFDLVTYLNQQSPEAASQILNSLPDTSTEENELKASIWNFKAESFKLEDKDFTPPEPLQENANNKEQQDYKKAVPAWKRLHLQHLAFALHKTLNELQSGGRHRSKYFQEIKAILENERRTRTFCGKLHSGSFKPRGSKSPPTVETLTNLIGHLSNLELKPLRKYFNDEKHKGGDHWDETRLNRIFEHWILREWRINLEKDKDKAPCKAGDYKKLCKDWKGHKGSVVDFWLKTNPLYTIPPYQDSNNRRPPRCQSLILNPTFLDNNYGAWQTWLVELKELPTVQEHLGDFEHQLESLTAGGKSKPYFSDEIEGKLKKDSGRRTRKNLDARILQFIFDRVKADDPLNLNKIYSHAKKYRQEQSTTAEKETAKNRLEDIEVKNSLLPDTLKTSRNYQNSAIFEQGSFLHLACHYYKIRQKAKDGRVFIHPEYRYVKNRGYENTRRFDDKDHLLTYCNHKPRQKRYQSFYDLAGVLQVSPQNLEEIIGSKDDDKVIAWVSSFKGKRSSLEGACKRAAKIQKEHRGFLRENLRKAIFRHEIESLRGKQKKKKNNLTSGDLGKLEKYSKTPPPEKDDKDLFNLDKNIKNLSHALAKRLFGQDIKQDDPRVQKYCSIFSFSQIYNIIFTERSGNANTCAVCSADNAQRMQMIASENGGKNQAKAQRLPAIETRLIDGAVMRMARIVGSRIADDKWKNIKEALEEGKHVRVPIITESNRFEFEPNLKEIKGKKLKDAEKKSRSEGQKKFAGSKDERIKEASLNICPYTDIELGNAGEVDHIIPRRSEWGTLNDEANLIWASHIGNHHKTNTPLSLGDLADRYKNVQFPDKDDAGIEKWIIEQIGDSGGEDFKFGPYRSFINLPLPRQKAFRHALFLSCSHPLRKKVINAINNRNRALVNGTQRYFADVLANNLHKKAKHEGKQHLLSFDYFEVSADAHSSNVNVPSVRKFFENKMDENGNFIHPEIQDHHKGNGNQSTYSHLIDAKTAFMIALSQHYKQGSFKINTQYISPFDYADNHGELKDLYSTLKIDYADFEQQKGERKLQRRKPEKDFFTHKTLFDSNPGAWHFLKLIEIESNDKKCCLKGFLDLRMLKSCLEKDGWQDAIRNKYGYTENDGKGNKKLHSYGELLTEAEQKNLFDLYSISENKHQFGYQNEKQQWPKIIIRNQKMGNNHFTVRLHQINKTKVAEFLLKNFNTKRSPGNWREKDTCVYKTLPALWYFTKRKSLIETGKLAFNCKEGDLKTGFKNPSLSNAWKELGSAWDEYKVTSKDDDCFDFLKGYFLKNRTEVSGIESTTHQRVRKEFSLPISAKGQGFMLIARTTWNNGIIYQCQAEKSGEAGVGLYKKRIDDKGILYDSLTPYFRSRNIVLLKKLNDLKTCLSEEGDHIDEDEWHPLQVPSEPEFKNVESMENKYQSKEDSSWRIIFKETPTMENLINLMYGGYHIDELKVGSNLKEKNGAKEEAVGFFRNTPNSFMSIEEAKQELEQQKNAINEKNNTQNRQRKTDADKKQLKFIQCWLQCLGGFNCKTLEYKRGVGLQIES